MWLELETSLPPTADADTDVATVLRYAATPTMDFAEALMVTVTFVPASPAVAVLVQARPRMPLPSLGLKQRPARHRGNDGAGRRVGREIQHQRVSPLH